MWGVLAVGLSTITYRVNDWYVMTNELLYERRAIAVARTLSPLPQLRGVIIPSFDQIYPLLIAPAFLWGLVPADLRAAHVINAWVMASACIPAFLLARRVLERRWLAYVLGALTVCVPWIIYSSFLLTEVAAYPAFLWAIFALERTISAPSRGRDAFAVLTLAVAFFTRTQFAVLAAVFPVAVLAFEVGRVKDGTWWKRPWRGFRAAVAAHRELAAVYGIVAIAAALLVVGGRLASTLGVYGDTISGNLFPAGTGSAFVQHVATLAIGIGILPFVVGAAWLLANLVRPSESRDRHAFACLGALALAAILLQVTSFDIRFGGSLLVHDRYLFYLAPLALLGFACAAFDRRAPRLSLIVPTALVALGFVYSSFATFTPLNSDTPVSDVNDFIMRIAAHKLTTARELLAGVTIVLALAFVVATLLVPAKRLAPILIVLLAVTLPAETAYAYQRLFSANGPSGRPLTLAYGNVDDFLDRTVGTGANVTMVSYPHTQGDFWLSFPFWRDIEFWNKSVTRAAYYPVPGIFESTGSTFPKIYLHFDPATGAASTSPTRYVAEDVSESRFRIDGLAVSAANGVLVIDAREPWRTDWLSYGLTDDGWTKPGVTARVRVFATPGQTGPVRRFVTFQIRPPDGVASRPVEISSNLAARHVTALDMQTLFVDSVPVCVPAHGFAEVRIRTPDNSSIGYGDMRDRVSFYVPRTGGVLLKEIDLADEHGPACSTR
jgi:hypothetical protein